MRKEQRRRLDLTALITPGKSAAGVLLDERTSALPLPLKSAPLSGLERLDYSSVSVWVRQGTVCQICVHQGYSGTLPEGIHIGSTIADVERLIGRVEEDSEDNLIVAGYPGWCFETEEWHGHGIDDNQDARITHICVNIAKPGEV